MIREVHYFEKNGAEHTETCLDIVKKLVKEGYHDIVVATTWGNTGIRFAETFKNTAVNLIVVTHSAGFKAPNEQELTKENRQKIEQCGAKVYTGTILTHSLETALNKEFGGIYPSMIITQTLRRFSQGVKVCVEIVMEACDAGYLPEEKEVVAVGGTGRGADTVCIIRSAASKRFLNLQVLEIAAKPR